MNSKMLRLLKEYPALSGVKKREVMETLLSLNSAEEEIYKEVFNENSRPALRFLADASRRKKSSKLLKPLVIEDAEKLLSIKDDKARKVAAILVGECAANECAEKLYSALLKEEIRYVRPSLILALGNCDAPEKYLSGYTIEPGETKHTAQESSALKKALSKAEKPADNLKINYPERAALTFVKKSALISELKEKSISYTARGERLIEIDNKYVDELRCYDEASYYLSNIKDIKTAALKLTKAGLKGHSYRIEAGKFPPQLKHEIIKKVSTGLADFGYIDNPSAYSFEIRVYRNGSLFAVLPQKNRFGYRKKTIAASINPVTAASVMQICKEYMRKDAEVLDPFCGSATMLFERAQALPYKKLVGVDKSAIAIKAAIANRKAACIDVSFLKSDILDYNAGTFDEVISNMPFGNRVSGHELNKSLYRLFAGKLYQILKQDGKAFLYTQEKKLLRESLINTGKFVIMNEEIFDSGGLFPTLFIIKRK